MGNEIRYDIPIAKKIIREEPGFSDVLKYVIEIDRYTLTLNSELASALNQRVASIPDILRKLADLTELAEKDIKNLR